MLNRRNVKQPVVRVLVERKRNGLATDHWVLEGSLCIRPTRQNIIDTTQSNHRL